MLSIKIGLCLIDDLRDLTNSDIHKITQILKFMFFKKLQTVENNFSKNNVKGYFTNGKNMRMRLLLVCPCDTRDKKGSDRKRETRTNEKFRPTRFCVQ